MLKSLSRALLLSAVLPGLAQAATSYPYTLQNCGVTVTVPKAPSRVVSVGQATTEILLSLGLADRMVGTAVWFSPLPAELQAANSGIKRLADNDPSFEAVVGQEPDLVTSQYEWQVGPRGSVGTRPQFGGLGIPTYIAPPDCVGKDNSGGGDGIRTVPFTTALIYQEIRELAAIFDVADRGEALVARLQKREADAVASVADVPKDVPVVVWFSSREVKGDAFVAGQTGVPAFLLNKLGERNVIEVRDEWPTVGWEAIVAKNPAVIVLARMDRRRFPADDVAVKIRFLETDPVTSRLEAVQKRRFIVIDSQALNPTMRVVGGLEVLAEGLRSFSLGK